MNDLPLVSIGIPAYKHEHYVQECIRSVVDQDYPRIELIVIDDGSKDGTWSKIQELRSVCEKRFERVVMISQENQGCTATCRRIEETAEGAIIGFVASDDKYMPGAIAKLIKPLIENDEVGLCVGRNILIDSEGVRFYRDAEFNKTYDLANARYKTFDDELMAKYAMDFNDGRFGTYATLVKTNYIPNGSLRKRSLLPPSVLFNSDAPLEDWWMHLQLSKVTKYKHIDDETFCYRLHGDNTVDNKEKMSRMYDATQLLERQHLLDCGDKKWIDIFSKDFYYSKPVVEFKICGHAPSIRDVRDFNTRQYRLVISRLSIPLTFKKKW